MDGNTWYAILNGAPAWVQAVGSILAILVAGRLVDLTNRKARLEKLDGVSGIVRFCRTIAGDAASDAATAVAVPAAPITTFKADAADHALAMLKIVYSDLVVIGSERLPRLISETTVLLSSSAAEIAKLSAGSAGAGGTAAAVKATLDENLAALEAIDATVAGFARRQRHRVKWWMLPDRIERALRHRKSFTRR